MLVEIEIFVLIKNMELTLQICNVVLMNLV